MFAEAIKKIQTTVLMLNYLKNYLQLLLNDIRYLTSGT